MTAVAFFLAGVALMFDVPLIAGFWIMMIGLLGDFK